MVFLFPIKVLSLTFFTVIIVQKNINCLSDFHNDKTDNYRTNASYGHGHTLDFNHIYIEVSLRSRAIAFF